MTPGSGDRHRPVALGKCVHVLFVLCICFPLSGLRKPSAAQAIHFPLLTRPEVCGAVSSYGSCFTGGCSGQASEGQPTALPFTRGNNCEVAIPCKPFDAALKNSVSPSGASVMLPLVTDTSFKVRWSLFSRRFVSVEMGSGCYVCSLASHRRRLRKMVVNTRKVWHVLTLCQVLT